MHSRPVDLQILSMSVGSQCQFQKACRCCHVSRLTGTGLYMLSTSVGSYIPSTSIGFQNLRQKIYRCCPRLQACKHDPRRQTYKCCPRQLVTDTVYVGSHRDTVSSNRYPDAFHVNRSSYAYCPRQDVTNIVYVNGTLTTSRNILFLSTSGLLILSTSVGYVIYCAPLQLA